MLKKNNLDKEIALRPDYIKLFEHGLRFHLKDYITTLDSYIVSEQTSKESLWRDPKRMAEYKTSLR